MWHPIAAQRFRLVVLAFCCDGNLRHCSRSHNCNFYGIDVLGQGV